MCFPLLRVTTVSSMVARFYINTMARKAVKKKAAAPLKKKPKKTGPKPIIPKNTPKRRKQIQEFKDKIAAQPAKAPHPFTRAGKPRYFNSPEEMLEEINRYFEWIEGETEKRKVKVPAANRRGYIEVEEEVIIRKSEPATVTGMCLFLGFAGLQGLTRYKTDHKEYVDIVNYGLARVAYGYEGNLHGAKCFGSIFALTNIDGATWKQKQEITDPGLADAIKQFNYIVPEPPPGHIPDNTSELLK